MSELINYTRMQTPIEIALGIDANGMTTARRLYEFLELDMSNYSKWFRKNILENIFAEENTDYWVFVPKDENSLGGRPTQDARLTASFAKKISMVQKNQKGEAARDYFTKVEDSAKKMIMQIQELSPELQAIFLHDKKIRQVETKVDAVNRDLQDFKMDLPILGIEVEKITEAVHKRGVNVLGGKKGNSYNDRSLRGKVYSDIYRELKRQFGVTTYKAIKRSQCDIAIKIIESYRPPLIIDEQIKDCNAQMVM